MEEVKLCIYMAILTKIIFLLKDLSQIVNAIEFIKYLTKNKYENQI